MASTTGMTDTSKDLKEKIRDLLRARKAILLAHNYQRPEVQDIADLCGDSLELSIKASQTDAEVIVFCGVHFMAETASILCPDKKVLLPAIVRRSFNSLEAGEDGEKVRLHISYQQSERQPRPLLIGFNTEPEKEFFERFITVGC